MNASPLITLRDVACVRCEGETSTQVEVAAFQVAPASVTFLTGETGCGKNLLLRLLGLLERPDKGEVYFEGHPTAQMTDDARASLRTLRCGYVFTSPFLLPTFSILENIAMPMFKVLQLDPAATRDRTEDLMEFTGLSAVATEHEVAIPLQYRAALARALAIGPGAVFIENLDVLLPADELGSFRELLHRVAERYKVAVVASAMAADAIRGRERRVSVAAGRVTQESVP